MVGPVIGNDLPSLATLRRQREELSPIQELEQRARHERLNPSELGRTDPATGQGGGLIDPVRVDGVSIAQEGETIDVARRTVNRADAAENRAERDDIREEAFLQRDDAAVREQRAEQLVAVEREQQLVDERRSLEDATAETLQERQAQATAAAIGQGALAQQFAAVQNIGEIGVDRRPEGEGAGRVTPLRPVDIRV